MDIEFVVVLLPRPWSYKGQYELIYIDTYSIIAEQ